MIEFQEVLSRFQLVTDRISPSSVTFNDGGILLEMYDEDVTINILKELNPEMAELVRNYGLNKTLEVLKQLELLAGVRIVQVN